MAYLFETNVLSELRRKERIDRTALSVLSTVDLAGSFISVISLLEIEIGALGMERRDPQQGAVFRGWLRQVAERHAPDRILDVTSDIASCAARLQVPNRRNPYDALIGATAIVHKFTLVTRNVRDFRIEGLRILDPWNV